MSEGSRNISAARGLSLHWLPLAGGSWRAKLGAIYLLSASVQLLVGWLFLFRPEVALLDFDEQEYWALGGQILAGLPMEVGRRTMAYPLFLAGLRSIADSIWFVQSCVALLAATAPPLLAMVVTKLTRSQASGAIAGLAFAFWPAQIFYGSSLYSETLALPVFLFFLWALPLGKRGDRRISMWRWVLAGAILGLTAHIRPMYQLFLPVLFLVLWIDGRGLAAASGRFALVVAGFALVVAPWSIYVSQQLGRPVLLSTNGGETLGGGFNPRLIENGERPISLPRRSTWDGPGKWIPMHETGYLSPVEQSYPYVTQDQLLRERTARWIQENPGKAAYLALRKLSYMWGIYPFAANGWRQALFGNVPMLVLLTLFVVTLSRSQGVRRDCARLYLLPVFVSGVALISWGSWRFRLPADAGMVGTVAILFAARTRAAFQRRSGDIGGIPCTTP